MHVLIEIYIYNIYMNICIYYKHIYIYIYIHIWIVEYLFPLSNN